MSEPDTSTQSRSGRSGERDPERRSWEAEMRGRGMAADDARSPEPSSGKERDEEGKRGDEGNRKKESDGGDAGKKQPKGKNDRQDDRDEHKDEKESGGKDKEPPPLPSKKIFIIAACIGVLLLGWGIYKHWSRNSEASDTQKQTTDYVPTVRVTRARAQDDPVDVMLPGQTEAFETANIFARATGYVTERRVDIGTRVKKGEVMLRISAPDLDQQLAQATAQLGQVHAAVAQARAQVAQTEANLALAKANFARADTLAQKGFETARNRDTEQANLQSQQANLATAQAGVKVADANENAQRATVERLQALAQFESVEAPFDGVVTARNVDVGNLLNADSGNGMPLLSVARDDILRVSVQVPQNSALGVNEGLEARVTVPEIPSRSFYGRVARSSVALLYSTRTLTTEIDIPNADTALRPGLFVDISFMIPRTAPSIMVPSDALIFDQHGMQVAVVDDDGKVKMHRIDIARDLGTSVELRNGLKGGEQVVVSPPTDLHDGMKVKVTEPEKEPGMQKKGDEKTAAD